MRTAFTAAVLAALVAVLSLPGKTFAAGTDTLVVYANGPSLDQVINSDTTSTGLQAHSVYKLVSLDTTYLYLGPVSVKSNLTVIGVQGPDKRPPTIQPGVLSDGSMSAFLFQINGAHTVASFKDLYLFGWSTAGGWNWGKDILVSADYVDVYVDNVIVDENRGEAIAYTGRHDNFYVTNCKFRNGVYPTDWFSSIAFVSDYPTNHAPDTVVMKYNTFFCIASDAAAPGTEVPMKYFEFTHNSVIYNFTSVFRIFTVTNAKINYNLFYSVYAGAEPVSEYPWWFQSFSPEINSIIDLDTLDAVSDSIFDPVDAGNSNWRMLAEAKRAVEVKGNIFYQPTKLTGFWSAWDDTTHGGDSLYTPTWMNNRTTHMFNDKTDWPGLTESGNINVDPGFGTSVLNVIDNAGGSGTGYGVGLLKYVTVVRNGKVSTEDYGYQMPTIADVTGSNWIPAWPLPEQTSGDLTYTAELTAPDGKPYGDPYWFTLSSTPGTFNVVSNGHSYVSSSAASSSYPDPNGTKLTDGLFAPDSGKFTGANLAGDPAWVGFLPKDTESVVIDLGQTMPVEQFMGDYLLDGGWGIYLHRVEVSVSTDNVTFTYLDSLRDSQPNNTAPSSHKFYLTLASPVNARYVKFSTIAPAAWVFVDEYQVLNSVATGIHQQPSSVPTKFDLSQNYPNPFNPSTNINFSVAQTGQTSLKVYNVLGQLVATVYEGMAQAHQNYTFSIRMDQFASGVYFYTLQQGSNIMTKKMLLLK